MSVTHEGSLHSMGFPVGYNKRKYPSYSFLGFVNKNKIELRQIRARLLLHSPGFPAGWEFRERTEAAG